MDIDDSSDKVRRNILIYSFSIVTSTFLDLDISEQGKLFSIIDLTHISNTKLWLVITIVLIYLFQRYWFDPERQKELGMMKSEFYSLRLGLIRKTLSNDAKKSILKNTPPRWISNFDSYLDDHLRTNYDKDGLPKKAEVTLDITESSIKNYSGEMHITYGAEWKSGNWTASSGGGSYKYQLSMLMGLSITLASVFRICTFSKTNVDFFVPLLLFFISLLICLAKLLN